MEWWIVTCSFKQKTKVMKLSNFNWRQLVLAGALLAQVAVAASGVNVLTYHNDNARTGQNLKETTLTPMNVSSANFGKLFTYAVDGYVYAQPLVVTKLKIPNQGVHDVVFITTEHDSVYAFDANNNLPALWHVSFINPAAGVTTVSSDDISCGDLVPEVGITSTPVIDLNSLTIYVSAKTKEVTTNGTAYYHRLHALDLTTGAEKFGGPTVIQASVKGNGDGNDGNGNVPFDSLRQFNRAALLLQNGLVYIGSAAHCDIGPYHGWLIGCSAKTMKISTYFNTTPNGGLGGIWQAGGGPASDASGNIFAETGNGTFDPQVNCYGDSFLKLSATKGLKLVDYFTPYNQQALSDADADLGSGGLMLLPDEAGNTKSNRHLLVGAGKEGTIYLVNRDHLGHFNPNSNVVVQTLQSVIGGSFDTPAYFNKHIYYLGAGDVLKSFSISNAQINPTPSSQSTTSFGFPGSTPSISANGTKNGIVWALQTDAYSSCGPAVLHAYNATNVAQELYSSANFADRDYPGGAVKFSVPTIANGKVYVGAEYAVSVYGLASFLPAPVIAPGGQTFTNSISVTITDAIPDANIFYTLDGSTPTTNSFLYTGAFTVTNSAGVQAKAFKPGALASTSVTATFLSSADIGSGTGLDGAYYSNQFQTFSNSPTLERIDATVDFDWGGGSPDPSISVDDFTVRWTGALQPQFSQTYTFYTKTDDGVRLWVDGQLLIDEWVDQGPTEWSGTISLNAGQKYSITMEYYENGGGASAQLSWSSPSLAKSIIPQIQLYPNFTPNLRIKPNAAASISAKLKTSGSNGFQMQVTGLIGKTYILQASTNLIDWVSLETNSAVTSEFDFTDPANTNFPSRFYRVIER